MPFKTKLIKATIYLCDLEGTELLQNKENLEVLFDNLDVTVKVTDFKETKIFWYDDIDLNSTDCDVADYEKYFEK